MVSEHDLGKTGGALAGGRATWVEPRRKSKEPGGVSAVGPGVAEYNVCKSNLLQDEQ